MAREAYFSIVTARLDVNFGRLKEVRQRLSGADPSPLPGLRDGSEKSDDHLIAGEPSLAPRLLTPPV